MYRRGYLHYKRGRVRRWRVMSVRRIVRASFGHYELSFPIVSGPRGQLPLISLNLRLDPSFTNQLKPSCSIEENKSELKCARGTVSQ